jgi:hypothetical protein
MGTVADSIEGLIYAEAQRGLALQPVLVNELRARTGILLGVTTTTTAFLGAIVIQGGGLHDWGTFALAAFVVAVVCCVMVLSPHREWKFTDGAARLLSIHCDQPRPDGADWTLLQVQREVALHMEEHMMDAINNMKGMQKWYAGAGCSLAVEIASWLLEYAN